LNDRWQSPIDRIIQDAINDGQLEGLPGTGKPLQLDDDPNTPDEMRMAYKILRENDLAPEWITFGKELGEVEARLVERVRRAVRAYRGALADADRMEGALAEAHRQNADGVWQSACRTLQEAVDAYNKQVLAYNLKVPPAIPQRMFFDLDREIQRIAGK
jgi:DnaJ family protein C protein 28